MNQAEVIAPEIERHSGFQIGQLAGEGQGEPVKSRNFHSQRQILSFDVGRTDFAVIGDSQHFRDLRSRHARRRVVARARVLRGIQLGDSGIRRPIAEETTNSRTIGAPGIGTDLSSPVNAATQIRDELVRIDRIPLANMEGWNHFC